MKIIDAATLNAKTERALLERPATLTRTDETTVRRICRAVRKERDTAVRRYTKQFDRITTDDLCVPEAECRTALANLPTTLRTALETAASNIRRFHEAQRVPRVEVETMPGVVCWRESRPIDAVGLYVPAGSAPLPSTVLMLGIPAMLAGCRRIVLCSPPRANGSVDPAVCATAAMIGISEIYRIGGVQAIAAMAYGTESVPRVDKIFGPGNRFVTAAKRIVSTDPDGCAIDLLAGPSEVLVIADEKADPAVIAWDLISQAEHDPDAHVVLVTTSILLAQIVNGMLEKCVAPLPRTSTIRTALRRAYALVVSSLEEAVRFSNAYAPEHLVVNTANQGTVVNRIASAGSVFLGAYAPVTAGDYASGTNHTLPTAGAARANGGVSLASFQKYITFQSLTRQGLESLAPSLNALADAEGLEAHKRAVTIRLADRKGESS